jgi:lipoate-protein ligase A
MPFEEGDAGALLERGAELLDALASDPVPALRWYQATAPAVVLGRGQGDLRVLAGTVTRFSGGGAVLLDEDILSLDVLLPAGHPMLDGEIGAVFDVVGRAWARALRGLGVPDVNVWDGPSTARRTGTDRERVLAAVCYATLGRGEVRSGARKLVGLAQRRRRPGALVQCGLLRRWRPARLLEALGIDPGDAAITGAAAGLADLVADPPSDAVVMRAVEREIQAS